MFTGIVQGKASVKDILPQPKLKRFCLAFPENALSGLTQGASIAINGCCLTVTEFDTKAGLAWFDVMQESLQVTNLDGLCVGDAVNFERAARIGDEIGGHLMSGHVTGVVTVLSREQTETNCTIHFSLPATLKKYVLAKGYVGLNGCSLTIGPEVSESFAVYLIPETLSVTTFGDVQAGDKINIEIDPHTQATVDTVERYLAEKNS